MGTWERRVEQLLAEVADLPSEEERERYLDNACRDDPSVRTDVEELLPYYLAADQELSAVSLEGLTAMLSPTTPDAKDGDARWAAVLEMLDPPQRSDSIGTLGVYQVTEVIGHGAMGVVLNAYDAKLGRFVAIKALLPDLARRDHYVRSFLAEARAMAAVRDPNVVAIHDVEDRHEPPYLVMEYVDGESLQAALRCGVRLELADVISIGIELARAVEAIHAQGIVHRDIKPSNILIERSTGRVRVTDFGIAIAASRIEEAMPAGTLYFMAPEQLLGGAIDERVDVFSVGCVLWMLARHASPSPTPANIRFALRRLCSSAERQALDRLQKFCQQLNSVSPCDRPASVESVREQLEEIAGELQRARRGARSDLATSRRVLLVSAFVGMVTFVFTWMVADRRDRPEANESRPTRAVTADGREVVIAFDLYDSAAPQPYRVENVVLVTEPDGVRYWRPERSGEWGEIVYRFRFPAPVRHATLSCRMTIWQVLDELAEAELHVSPDGNKWHEVAHLRDGFPDVTHMGPVTVVEPVRGSREVYVKARLRSQDRGRSHNGMALGPAYAQFLRCDSLGTYGKVFHLSVELEVEKRKVRRSRNRQ